MAVALFFVLLLCLQGEGGNLKAQGCGEVKLYIHKDCCNAEHYKFSGGLKKNVNMQLMQNFMDGHNLIY